MFIFEKRTQIPVCIKNRNPRLAGIILEQYGGADGELSASLRYLSQRFTMPDNMGKGLLTDIGTEELGHLEIIGSIVGQLTDGEGQRASISMGTAITTQGMQTEFTRSMRREYHSARLISR